MIRKGREPLILKYVIMIETITEWFEITQYNNKKSTTIENLVETTGLVRYSWPVEITYDWRGEFLGREFKRTLIEQEYGNKTKPASLGNTQSNTTIEIIHQVLVLSGPASAESFRAAFRPLYTSVCFLQGIYSANKVTAQILLILYIHGFYQKN